MTEFQKHCVEIYLKYHVSQLRSMSWAQQAWWKLGQKIYHENKLEDK